MDGADPDHPPEPLPPTTEVFLNVYDVVPPDGTGGPAAPITRLNNLTRNLFGGVGGVFHGAIVIGDVEFSFGYCESGSGVYHVRARQNPMYTFRETISLGHTTLDQPQARRIMAIVRRMRAEWPGLSYDLLSRNCCHFCDVLASELCVKAVPAWLNRFAVTGASALQATNDASNAVKGIREELSRLSGESVSWVRAGLQRTVQAVQAGAQGARTAHAARGDAGAPATAAALFQHAGGVVKAAARGWQTALNGPAATATVLAVAASSDATVAPAPAAAAAMTGGGGEGGGSQTSGAGGDGAALPTTALRWAGSVGGGATDDVLFVGSNEPLGKPQGHSSGAAGAAGATGGGGAARRPPSDGGAFALEAGDEDLQWGARAGAAK